MRACGLLLWFAALSLQANAYEPVTAARLGQLLAAAQGRSDAEVARQLVDLQLTERLSAWRLSQLQAGLPGTASRRALVAIADASAFLNPAAAEVPATAAPDLAAQRRMMALTVDYVTKTTHQLPNLYTTRVTTSFEDDPWRLGSRQNSAVPAQTPGAVTSAHPLHFVNTENATVLYRKGEEVIRADAQRTQSAGQGLTTSGEFGPILGTAMLDAARSKLGWSHWEQAPSGPIAVYRYAVPADKSHYEVKYCCIVRDTGDRIYFQQFAAYQGEIAVDPASGAILRLTLQAELKPTDPLVRADLLVEYAPVDIGGKLYICPVRGVALSIGLALHTSSRQGAEDALRPLQTSLNDIAFKDYHVFRAQARMLSADNDAAPGSPAPAGVAVDSVAQQGADASPANSETPETPVLAEESVRASATAAEGSAGANAREPAPGPVAAPETSEITVAASPDLAATVPSAQDKSFTLRVTTRLVDVGVVAVDKKGAPVADLTAENFELYDDGRRQEIRSFRKAGSAAGSGSAVAPGGPAFSNSRATVTDAGPGAEQGSVTVLLIDASNLAWADLSHVRGEMLRFLRALSPDERVALYVMQARGFKVLEEGTTDHALLIARLTQWMPGAQDLARAQAEEQQTRQQFEEVRNVRDLESVNGNTASAPESGTPDDAQLRSEGSNAERGALVALASVARHLAVLGGHKNLVWVTSDNVLANWTDKAVSSDRGGKEIGGLVLRAQEAINEAHAALYPLDASQLEAAAVDASIKNRNIELAPSSMDRAARDPRAGRMTAEMEQDTHPVQAAMNELAQATGGRVFGRAGDIATELSGVVADGRASYLLGFTPAAPADDRYHSLTVKVGGRRGVALRYRTGYQYARVPATRADRLREAIWQSLDANDIAVTANPANSAAGNTLLLNIAARDVAWKQQDERWSDTLDIFVARREDDGLHAHVDAQTLKLALKPATYQALLEKGIPFEQLVKPGGSSGSVRILVLDENSGLMGSITVPAAVLAARP